VNAMTDRSTMRLVALFALLPAALFLLSSCAGSSVKPPTMVDLAPFEEMARAAGCADIRNRLFLIDGQLVFWDRAGACADAAYGETLYGSSPDQVLCDLHDSIAGPVKNCSDVRYQDTFDTITINLDQPDLGLGPKHTVQPVNS
jgi:hypothetical protein